MHRTKRVKDLLKSEKKGDAFSGVTDTTRTATHPTHTSRFAGAAQINVEIRALGAAVLDAQNGMLVAEAVKALTEPALSMTMNVRAAA